MNFESIVPTLQCTDLELAETFYASLGFEREWGWPEDYPSHASFSNGDISFMTVRVPVHNTIQCADLYFTMKDIDQYYNQLVQRNIQVSKIVNSSYGMRDFSLNDPWGHHFVFGSSIIPEETEKKKLTPTLNEGDFVFCHHPEFIQHGYIASFKEKEGWTFIFEKSVADIQGLSYRGIWSWISFGFQSDLEMVGLTANFSNALAQADIPCNVVAAFYHDHIFVPVDRAQEALTILAQIEC